MEKDKICLAIAIGILILVISLFFIYSFGGANIGEPCGFDYGNCKTGLFCGVIGVSSTTGNQFGSCQIEPNTRGESDGCGQTIIGCCKEGLVCAIQPDGKSYCFRESDIDGTTLIKINEKPCFG